MFPRSLLVALVVSVPAIAADPPAKIAPYFTPPKQLATDLGTFRSPLKFDDGSEVKTAADWKMRRAEIRKYWHGLMGEWPALIEKPKVELGEKEQRGTVTQHKLKIETAPGRTVEDAYLLVPEGKGPFPAVLVVFYEANTGVGKGKAEFRDYAFQLANRGFVTLSLGGDPNTYYPTKEKCRIQPLSFHAYEAANCCTALAQMPNVDPKRIGVVGHSYGGKWALFAAALHNGFACGAVSDPGIVFDETRSNVNYWEPWYLGFDPALKEQRKAGIPSDKNPRTGPYKKLMEDGRDLTDLHALLAPRPFFVSGRGGRPGGAVEGAQPPRGGEQVARRDEPRGYDQPPEARLERGSQRGAVFVVPVGAGEITFTPAPPSAPRSAPRRCSRRRPPRGGGCPPSPARTSPPPGRCPPRAAAPEPVRTAS